MKLDTFYHYWSIYKALAYNLQMMINIFSNTDSFVCKFTKIKGQKGVENNKLIINQTKNIMN